MASDYPKVKRCEDCRWSNALADREWDIKCQHPLVNIKNPWYLSGGHTSGSDAREERGKKWLAPCGMKGKLFEEQRDGR